MELFVIYEYWPDQSEPSVSLFRTLARAVEHAKIVLRALHDGDEDPAEALAAVDAATADEACDIPAPDGCGVWILPVSVDERL